MNVASSELCLELYELSEWDKTQNVWAFAQGEEDKDLPPWLRIGVGDSYAWKEFPAYDLGYLLRKLPDHLLVKFVHVRVPNKWFVDWRWKMEDKATIYTDTPEDAICKLAIELFKQGVLKNGK